MRYFVGLDLAIPVVERLTLVQDEVTRRCHRQGVRHVLPENIHLTLKALGELEPAMVPVVAQCLRALTRPLFPFEFRTAGVSADLKAGSPRLVYATLDDQGTEVMGLLHESLDRDLEEVGIERDARPHRTQVLLTRLIGDHPQGVGALVDGLARVDFGITYVRDLALYAVDLSNEGPIYRVHQRFALGEH